MLLGGAAIGLLGVGFYLVPSKRAEPAKIDPSIKVAVVVPSSQPAPAPVVLDRVVDVTDIDHLLEPPPIPAAAAESGPVITRVGYEELAAPRPANANAPAIPKSLPDEPRIIIHSEEEITRTEEEEISNECNQYSPDEDQDLDWESEFRPARGELWLDANALTPLLLAEKTGRFMFSGPRHFMADVVAASIRNPLTPLHHLTDSDLFEQTPRHVSASLFPASEPVDSRKAIVRRAYDIFHVGNQRPASRLDWYTRLYGDAPIPHQVGLLLTQKRFLEQYDAPPVRGLRQRYQNHADAGLFF